jgi:chromosome segregation ATPase
VAAAAPQGSSMGKLFGNMPAAMATYAGVKELSKHADTAKEWATWLEDLHETPEEIDSLSNKASTARDTIKQVEQTLKTRPDLLEGEDGERLREQIEDAVKSTNKALGKMTTLLAEITKKGAKNGDVINGLQDFWRSYRYKDEFEGKIKAADDALQKELTLLGNLMFNIHS